MLHSGSDSESYITKYTLVYEDNRERTGKGSGVEI